MTEHPGILGDGEAYASFAVRHHRVDQLVVVTVSGEVDAVTAPHLSAAIGDAIAGTTPSGVIVDLSDVSFLASAGLGVLVATHDQVAGTARFGVVANGPFTRRPITVLGLDTIITLYRTVADAVADMGDR